MSTEVLLLDRTDRIGEMRRRLRQHLRQQHALAASGVINKAGYYGGELRALEVAYDMLVEVRSHRRCVAKTALTAVLDALAQEYQRMGKLAGELRGPWFLGFSGIWRRVAQTVESLPLLDGDQRSPQENHSSQSEN